MIAPPLQQAAFETARLRVFELHAEPCPGPGGIGPRRMFVAVHREVIWPGIVATCSVWPAYGNAIDWIEVIQRERGKGVATELLAGIEAHIGEPLSGETLVDKIHAQNRKVVIQ